jgi:hypothetical protein
MAGVRAALVCNFVIVELRNFKSIGPLFADCLREFELNLARGAFVVALPLRSIPRQMSQAGILRLTDHNFVWLKVCNDKNLGRTILFSLEFCNGKNTEV